MTSVPHSGAKSVTPGGSVAGGHTDGPWVIRRDIDGLTILGGPNNEAIWCIAGYLPGGSGEMEANARLIAAAPCLLAALNDLQDVFARDGECSMERFERLAEMFRRDTGYLAPGKDQPMGGADQPDGDDLRRIYDDWFAAKVTRARAAIAKATAGETHNAEPIHRRDGDST